MKLYVEKYDFSSPWIKEKTPLVLIHGLGVDRRMWFWQVPDFSKHFPVLLIDLPGCGNSPDPGVDYTIEMMADNVADTLKDMGIEKANICGISLGGVVAAEYATKYPEAVENLILVAVPEAATDELKPQLFKLIEYIDDIGVEKVAEESSHKAFSELADINVINFLKEMTKSTNHSVYVRCAKSPLLYNIDSKLKDIKSRTLIVSSEYDFLAPIDMAKNMSRKIKNSELYILKNAGHAGSMEKPDEFNKAVLSFLIGRN
jgi:pimeloyl-ACP methyl ester carboxylesterase